jgi:hypothetical protein
MLTANLHCLNHLRHLRAGSSQPSPSGAFEPDPGTLGPRWPNGRNIPSGKQTGSTTGRAPCDLGHCKSRTKAINAAPGARYSFGMTRCVLSFFPKSFIRRNAPTGPFLHLFRPP